MRKAVFILILSVPIGAYAAGLVPCGGPDEAQCNACHFVELGQRLLTWLITFSIAAAGVIFAWAGMRMVMAGGNEGEITAAKSMFTNVVVGIVILLAAWLIVDTVMKLLVKEGDLGNGIQIGPWNDIQCSGPGVSAFLPPTPGVISAGELTHDDALRRLTDAGINVTSTAGAGGVMETCSSGTGCTTLNGIREDTIQQVMQIKAACGLCDVTITGATEPGHESGDQSHANGYKIDIDDNSTLDSYITKNLTRDGTREGDHGGARYRDSCGNEYVRESNHWDIAVTSGSCPL